VNGSEAQKRSVLCEGRRKLRLVAIEARRWRGRAIESMASQARASGLPA
jgi:hypothetical protein